MKTNSAMMRSQVALYPVDLKGIQVNVMPGDAISEYQRMDAIAESTGGHAYYGNNRVVQLMDKAVENGESYYTLSYAPTNPKYDGSERSVEVTLANAKRTNTRLVTGTPTMPYPTTRCRRWTRRTWCNRDSWPPRPRTLSTQTLSTVRP